MRRLLLFGTVAVGIAITTRRLARRCERVDFEHRIERLPERSPRRWMVRNISVIRGDTQRILELLERERADARDQPAQTAA